MQRERDRERVKSFVLPSVKPSPNHNQQQQEQPSSLFSYPEIPSINTSNNNNNGPSIVKLKPPHLPHSIFDNPYSSPIQLQQKQPITIEASTSPVFPLNSSIPSPSLYDNDNNKNNINLLSPPHSYQLQQQQQQVRKPIVPYHILSPNLPISNSTSQGNSIAPSPLPFKTTFESILESKNESPLLLPLELQSPIDLNKNPSPPPFPEMLPSPKIDTIIVNNNNNINNNSSSKIFPKLSVRTELDESQSLETTSKYCVLEKREEKKEDPAIISPSSNDGYNNGNEIKRDFNKSNTEISISEIPVSSNEVGNEGEVDVLNEFVEKKGKWDILDANLATENK